MDIVIENISKAFEGKQVLFSFSARIREGECTSVMGPSGCGKTTLARLIIGLEAPDRGSIKNVPERISAVFQEDRLCEDFGAISNVRFVTGREKSDAEIAAELSSLGLADSLKIPVRNLSGGMKRRVALARALCRDFDLLLLDEPFKGLDAALKEQVAAHIRTRTEGKTVICVTHEEEDAGLLGAKTVILPKRK